MIDLLNKPNTRSGANACHRPKRIFLETVAAFARDEVAPHADEWERAEALPVRSLNVRDASA